MEGLQKVIRILVNILMTLILIIGGTFIILFIFGIQPFVVETGSMSPAITQGSLSFINKNIEYSQIKENDIIAFTASSGDKVTHRVVSITDEGFETKGDSNENTDGISTTKKNYMGKNVFSIPKLGLVVKVLQTVKGKIMLITVIIVILLAGFLTDASKDKKKKEKQEKVKETQDK